MKKRDVKQQPMPTNQSYDRLRFPPATPPSSVPSSSKKSKKKESNFIAEPIPVIPARIPREKK